MLNIYHLHIIILGWMFLWLRTASILFPIIIRLLQWYKWIQWNYDKCPGVRGQKLAYFGWIESKEMNAGQDVRSISSVTDFSVYNILGTVLQLISDSGLDSHLKHTLGLLWWYHCSYTNLCKALPPCTTLSSIFSWYFSPLISGLHVKGVYLRIEDELFCSVCWCCTFH